MLDDSERAELEEFRRQDRIRGIVSLLFVGLMILAVGSCPFAAYRADALYTSTTGFGIDLAKMVRYYRGEPQKVEEIGVPPSVGTPQAVSDIIPPLSVEPLPFSAEK